MKPMSAIAGVAAALMLSPVVSLAEGRDGWELKQRSDDPRAGYAPLLPTPSWIELLRVPDGDRAR